MFGSTALKKMDSVPGFVSENTVKLSNLIKEYEASEEELGQIKNKMYSNMPPTPLLERKSGDYIKDLNRITSTYCNVNPEGVGPLNATFRVKLGHLVANPKVKGKNKKLKLLYDDLSYMSSLYYNIILNELEGLDAIVQVELLAEASKRKGAHKSGNAGPGPGRYGVPRRY